RRDVGMTPAFRTAGSRYFADATSRARVARSCADNAYAHAPRRPNRARHTPAHASLATGAARRRQNSSSKRGKARSRPRPPDTPPCNTRLCSSPQRQGFATWKPIPNLSWPAVVQFVFTVGDGLDPIRKSAHELAVIVGVARGKI